METESAAEAESKHIDSMEDDRKRLILASFSNDQLARYEVYNGTAFPKGKIKKLIQNAIKSQNVSPDVVIAIGGIAKVFVGELVEASLDAMEHAGEIGPIQPKHIREAVRKLRLKGGIPKSKCRRFSPYPL